MKILFISYLSPPIGGMTPLRVGYFAKHLSSTGHKVYILSIEANEDQFDLALDHENLELLEHSRINIFRTYPGPVHRLKVRSSNFLNSAQDEVRGSTNFKSNSSHKIKKLSRGIKRFIKPLAIPDGRVEWLPWALSKGVSILNDSYDMLVSFGHPFTCHIVAYLLKVRFDLPWLADYGDPWSFHPATKWFPGWRRSLDKWLEAKLLRRMDRTVVCTETTKQAYMDRFKFLSKDQVRLITNGYSAKEYGMNFISPDRDVFRLVYTGNFYDVSSPKPFFRAIANFTDKNVRVDLAGDHSKEYKNYVTKLGIADLVNFLGYQSHSKVVKLQKKASALLLFGVPAGFQIPSKFFEYVAARRPILSIRYDKKDLAARRIEENHTGLVAKNESSDIFNQLKRLHSLWREDELNTFFNLEGSSQFSWENLANQFEKALSSVK